ncbi:TrbC-like protein [Salmonella enterica subsp. arizonae]|uniref:TrbC-like protein n=1 Tax=Salmonella enterica subsp. arizonae TaxID=59203 RepID=A0A379SI51_SALER|nr:TrbC-like protein [Salmonella enterica subsp. arizonae]
MALLEEYDTDINAREMALWETALNTLKTTTREQRRIRFITLNRPETPAADEEHQVSVRAERAELTCYLCQNKITVQQDLLRTVPIIKITVVMNGKDCTEKRPCRLLARPFFYSGDGGS